MTTRKQRHHIYLPDQLSATLDAIGGAAGSSKSAVVTEALQDWVDRRAAGVLDDRIGLRLDRITTEQQAMTRDLRAQIDLVRVSLATFVQHQLTVAAHLPAFTPEAAHLGQQRFQLFTEAVGRKLARASARDAEAPSVRPATDVGED